MTDSLIQTPNPDQVVETQFEADKNYLEDLIGPGGKFHDPDRNKALEKLARGKIHADNYVPILEKRLDQMRSDYSQVREDNVAGKKLQELIDKMTSMQNTNSNSAPPLANEQLETKPAVDLKDIQSLISKEIQEDRITREQTQNYNQVVSKLTERYGPNYGAQLQKQYQELGINDSIAANMARTTPRALEKLLGLDVPVQGQNFQAPPQTGNRKDSFGTSSDTHTWGWYQQLKAKDPKTYYSKKTAAQMEQDYAELGRAFEDGDFHS